MLQLESTCLGVIKPRTVRVASNENFKLSLGSWSVRRTMRRAVRPTTAGVGAAILFLILGATLESQDSLPADDAPAVVVWRYAGIPGPSERLVSGLELAVWSDGAILIASSRCSAGRYILVGRVEPKEVTELMGRIREEGFLGKWRTICPVDAGFTRISVRRGEDVVSVAWTECLMPGVSGDLTRDSNYRSFVRMWRRTRGAIESLAPIELASLEEQVGKNGVFRGYRVDAPVKTAWRPE